MNRRNAVYVVLALAIALSLVAACAQPTPTPAPKPQPTQAQAQPTAVPPTAVPPTAVPATPKLGSKERPIQLYFVPSVDVAVIVESGDKIAKYLTSKTGLEFKVSVPTSYAATIEAMGQREDDAMAFIPAQPYVFANMKYGITVGLATVRNGNYWYATEYIVRADSGINKIEDLNGKKWACPDILSTSGYLYPMAQLKKLGIEPDPDILQAGKSHPNVVLAVYNKQVDFGTVFYSPPLIAGGTPWKWGDAWQPEGKSRIEKVAGKNQAFIGDAQILDARANVIDQFPDVIDQVKIIGLSDQIPNDTVSFVKGFPQDVKDQIMEALIGYGETEEGKSVLSNKDFYGITGFAKVDDSFYDPVRNLIQQLGIKEDDVLKK